MDKWNFYLGDAAPSVRGNVSGTVLGILKKTVSNWFNLKRGRGKKQQDKPRSIVGNKKKANDDTVVSNTHRQWYLPSPDVCERSYVCHCVSKCYSVDLHYDCVVSTFLVYFLPAPERHQKHSYWSRLATEISHTANKYIIVCSPR